MYLTEDDLLALLQQDPAATGGGVPNEVQQEAAQEPTATEQDLGAMMQQAELQRNSLLYPLLEKYRRKELQASDFANALKAAKASKDRNQAINIQTEGITFLQNLGDDAPAYAKIYSEYFPGQNVVKYKTNAIPFQVSDPQATARNQYISGARIKYERDYNRMMAERGRWQDAQDADLERMLVRSQQAEGTEPFREQLRRGGGVGASSGGDALFLTVNPKPTPPPERIEFPNPEPEMRTKYRQVDFTVGKEPRVGGGSREYTGQFTLPSSKGEPVKITGNYSSALNVLKSVNENVAPNLNAYVFQEHFGDLNATQGSYTINGVHTNGRVGSVAVPFSTIDGAAYAQLAQYIMNDGEKTSWLKRNNPKAPADANDIRSGNAVMLWNGIQFDPQKGVFSVPGGIQDPASLQTAISSALTASGFFDRKSKNYQVPYSILRRRTDALGKPFSETAINDAIVSGIPFRLLVQMAYGGNTVGGDAIQFTKNAYESLKSQRTGR